MTDSEAIMLISPGATPAAVVLSIARPCPRPPSSLAHLVSSKATSVSARVEHFLFCLNSTFLQHFTTQADISDR